LRQAGISRLLSVGSQSLLDPPSSLEIDVSVNMANSGTHLREHIGASKTQSLRQTSGASISQAPHIRWRRIRQMKDGAYSTRVLSFASSVGADIKQPPMKAGLLMIDSGQ
jgi:hypothetical protein